MDGTRFDEIARRLGGTATRRAGLKAALGAIAAAVPALAAAKEGGKRRAQEQAEASADVEAAAGGKKCVAVGRRCGKTGNGRKAKPCSECCSGYWTGDPGKTRCTCRPEGRACSRSSECCSGICDPETGQCATDEGTVPLARRCIDGVDVCADAEAACQRYMAGGRQTYCLLDEGESCPAGRDDACVTETCALGKVVNPNAADARGLSPRAPVANICCRGEGSVCANDAQCCFGFDCISGRCAVPPQTCNAANCPTGCCDGNVCVTPVPGFCGIGGAACVACSGATPVCDTTTGTCEACAAIGSACVLDTDCCSADCGVNGTCVLG